MITGIGSGPGGATVLQLDRALKWTHLGEVVAVQGDEAGRTVSQRAPCGLPGMSACATGCT